MSRYRGSTRADLLRDLVLTAFASHRRLCVLLILVCCCSAVVQSLKLRFIIDCCFACVPGTIRLSRHPVPYSILFSLVFSGSGQDGDKPQFVPSKEMATSTKEILPPPDREAVCTIAHVSHYTTQTWALTDTTSVSIVSIILSKCDSSRSVDCSRRCAGNTPFTPFTPFTPLTKRQK